MNSSTTLVRENRCSFQQKQLQTIYRAPRLAVFRARKQIRELPFVSMVKQVDTTDQLLIREMGEIGGFVRWIGYDFLLSSEREKNPLFCKSCRFEPCLRHKTHSGVAFTITFVFHLNHHHLPVKVGDVFTSDTFVICNNNSTTSKVGVLSHGVMVAQQVLVLFDKVRILVGQLFMTTSNNRFYFVERLFLFDFPTCS